MDKKVLGLILELNPPHNGHKYFIQEAIRKVNPDVVVCIMTTNFSMRGEVCVLDKFSKTELALSNNIDIVLELPYLGSICASSYFAHNCLLSLSKLNITDLAFGCEEDNLEKLNYLKNITSTSSFQNSLKSYLDKGYSYSTSCNKALELIVSSKDLITQFSLPNNTLGIQYLKAIEELNLDINITLIKRIENNYFDRNLSKDISSATSLRLSMEENKDISKYLISNSINYINIKESLNNLFLIFKSTLLLKDIAYFKNILNVNEGIENRLFQVIINSNNYYEFINNALTKRYKENLIKRLILNIILDVNNTLIKDNTVNYLRILGFNEIGSNYIKTLKPNIKKEIITSFKNITNNINVDFELKATKLYGIITNNLTLFNKEYTIPIRRN